jgi:hypothetical protein
VRSATRSGLYDRPGHGVDLSTIDGTVTPDGLAFSRTFSTIAQAGPPLFCAPVSGTVQGVRTGGTTTTSTPTSTTTTVPSPCGTTPQCGCQPALETKANLTLKDSSNDAKDQLSWSWASSAAVPEADFEDPVTGRNDDTICISDGSGRRLEATAPAGGVCGTKPCWKKTRSSGFVYTDKLLDPDGLGKVVLEPGSAAGKSRIKVQGKGAA